eukprot:678736-Pleurochrysis_carterae.AAC.5
MGRPTGLCRRASGGARRPGQRARTARTAAVALGLSEEREGRSPEEPADGRGRPKELGPALREWSVTLMRFADEKCKQLKCVEQQAAGGQREGPGMVEDASNTYWLITFARL